jgi:hypothetical protein
MGSQTNKFVICICNSILVPFLARRAHPSPPLPFFSISPPDPSYQNTLPPIHASTDPSMVIIVIAVQLL